MRIAELAPVWERVPPLRYGGIELVVSLLTEELVKRGHKVTLFASGDSKTKAELSFVYPTKLSRDMMVSGEGSVDIIHATRLFKRAGEFDIIHSHLIGVAIAMASLVKTPVLTTLHGPFTENNKKFFTNFKDDCYYSAISHSQMNNLPDLNYVGVIYNAIDMGSYKFEPDKSDYFVFLSRLSPLKAPHLAIEVAKRAGVKLIMAGKVDPGSDAKYFEEKVAPQIDGEQIKFLGEVSDKKKRELLEKAKAFIFPLQWPEPFGLVMPEAMACGTPVIAFPFGSVPEVVKDGVSGFIVEDIDQMVSAVKRVNELSPAACRSYAEERFSVGRMTDDYEAAFETILKKRRVG